jgi:hypothetical protein
LQKAKQHYFSAAHKICPYNNKRELVKDLCCSEPTYEIVNYLANNDGPNTFAEFCEEQIKEERKDKKEERKEKIIHTLYGHPENSPFYPKWSNN